MYGIPLHPPSALARRRGRRRHEMYGILVHPLLALPWAAFRTGTGFFKSRRLYHKQRVERVRGDLRFTICDLRFAIAFGDCLICGRQREGRAPARPRTAWGQRTRRSASLPYASGWDGQFRQSGPTGSSRRRRRRAGASSSRTRGRWRRWAAPAPGTARRSASRGSGRGRRRRCRPP